jgi:hypothetical protein
MANSPDGHLFGTFVTTSLFGRPVKLAQLAMPTDLQIVWKARKEFGLSKIGKMRGP